MSRIICLSLGALLAGCTTAYADIPPGPPPEPGQAAVAVTPGAPTPAEVALDEAVGAVSRSAAAVAAGVADGSIDVRVDGPAIITAFARLSLDASRLSILSARTPAPAAAELAEAEVEAPPPGSPAAKVARAPTGPTIGPDGKPITSVGGGRPATTSTSTSTSTSTASSDSADAADSSGGPEKTGVASVDKFLGDSDRLSKEMTTSRTRLESARTKTASTLSLSKKFKPEDAKAALKKELGSFKVSKGPPVKLVPGDDAKNPAVATSMQGVVADIMALKDSVPKMVITAVDLGKQGAALPTTAKQELLALGPMSSAQAIAKITKQVKVVTKIPKDAKELSEEVAEWVKIFTGG